MMKRSGVTLIELVVTIAVMAVVMSLLAIPLMMGSSYVQKATAIREAQRAGEDSSRRLRRDIETSMYIFDLPPDGSWVSLVPEAPGGTGQPMDAAGNATLIRYTQVLDFPWTGDDGATVLLNPNYASSSFGTHYADFYSSFREGANNPYILGRYEQLQPWKSSVLGNKCIWGTNGADGYGTDGAFPMNTYTDTTRENLWRRFRNEMIATTPYGNEWDVPVFQVTPLRLNSEALQEQLTSDGRTTHTFSSRYPLWAARNSDYEMAASIAASGGEANPFLGIADFAALYPQDTNPYGYSVRIYDKDGAMVYGYNPTANTFKHTRHFMDWPAYDRPDVAVTQAWTKATVDQQRLAGKLVFAQPLPIASLKPHVTGVKGVDGSTPLLYADIATPESGAWQSPSVTALPHTMIVNGITFNLSLQSDPQKLQLNEYCLSNSGFAPPAWEPSPRKYYVGDRVTPTVANGHSYRCISSMASSNTTEPGWPASAGGRVVDNGITWQLDDGNHALVFYTLIAAVDPGWAALSAPGGCYISDLQPGDRVVATYSTRAVLNIALAVSRLNRATGAGRNGETFNISMQVEAGNAARRARGSE
ncbi:MAG: type II secretion system protein [bacterium]